MFLIYEVVLSLVFVLLLPGFLFLRLIRGKPTGGLAARMGLRLGRGSHDLWIHAVSVGEVAAARVIVDKLLTFRPGTTVLVTTTTVTGQTLARRIFHDATVTWFPFDFTVTVKRFINAYKPSSYVTIETELWPNIARILFDRNIPALLVNGRISDRSFPRYRMIRPLARQILRRYQAILAREEVDRERFVAMGADPAKVSVAGNVKFDYEPSDAPLEFIDVLDVLLGGRALFIAGSTTPGEEELIAGMIPGIVDRGVVTVLAPRKPGRFDEVAALLEQKQIRFIRRSELVTGSEADVILLDTIGELSRLYRHARAAFVGGSLVPSGGHNPIEPAAVGVPVAFGPHMNNFRDITTALVRSGAGVTVEDIAELQAFIVETVENESIHDRRSRAAVETVAANRGAADKIASRIVEMIG